MDIYLGRKQTPEFNLGLGEEVVLQLTKDLEQPFCTAYFDKFFNSPKLIEKLFQKGINGIGTVWANRKRMPKMIDDKQMKRGDCKFLFSVNTMACKRMDNRSVLLLWSALEGMNDTLSVQRRPKGSKTKSLVPCHKVVKFYNSGMGGVDLMDQHTAAYRLDWKSSVRFYFLIFFDVMDIACVNSYLIYNMKHTNNLSLLDYNIVVAKHVFNTIKTRKGQYQCRYHLRGRTNLNRLIIMEDIYQVTKRWENDRRTVQWKVKKIEHSSSVWLVTFHYA